MKSKNAVLRQVTAGHSRDSRTVRERRKAPSTSSSVLECRSSRHHPGRVNTREAGSQVDQAHPARVKRPDQVLRQPSRVVVALLLRWLALAVAFAITAWLLNGMDVSGGFGTYLWLALLFGLINAIIGTLLRLLTLPLMVVTLGLFAVVINAFLLELLNWITDSFTIDHFFWTAIWGAIILSVVSVILDALLGAAWGRRRTPAPA